MANKDFKKNTKKFIVIIAITLILTTVGIGVFAFYKMPQESRPALNFNIAGFFDGVKAAFSSANSAGSSSGADPTNNSQGTSQPVVTNSIGKYRQEIDYTQYFNRPSEMRAVYITPGVDYLVDGNMNADKIKADIDAALASADELTMNTVILPLYYNGQAIYQKTPTVALLTEFDVLEYIITAARENGFYIYGIYDCFSGTSAGLGESPVNIDSALVDEAVMYAKSFAENYDIDGILLDNYYYEEQQNSYFTYMSAGGGMGYENYLQGSTKSVFSGIARQIRRVAPHMQIGMCTEAVWANAATNDLGSNTSAGYTTLYSGNSNNREYITEGIVDFVAVKALEATTNTKQPFAAVIKWWGTVAEANEIPMYVVHAADKAGTDNAGWTEYDQLTRQVIATETTPGFSGSIFNSLARMKEDPKESTSKLLLYYQGKIQAAHVLTDLELTAPLKKTYTTFEKTATFKGASDPNTVITLNGKEISTDQNGYFTMSVDLEPGLNRFEFVHKGKTDIYNITRQIVVLKEITPVGNMSVNGGMQITITATAYEEAKVYAVVGGQTITMTKMDANDDSTEIDSSYVKFVGTYTAPAATTVDQKIGNIVVYGEAQGQTDTKQGAYVTVNRKLAIEDGKPVVVVAEQAETFPTSVVNEYSHPNYFPLPKGTYDYTVGSEIIYNNGTNTYSFYRLASDLRVQTEDIKAVSDSEGVGSNKITGMTVTSDGRYTKVILKTAQKVSYKGSYDSTGFSLAFNYTTTVTDGLSLNQNPLFSSATWSGTTLKLKFTNSNGFFGYTAYYDSDGNLVLRFNNPPEISGSSLAGARIVVDPGHGGSDPGALGFLQAYPESVITRQIAEHVAEELRSRGATVLLLETGGAGKTVVSVRMQRARAFDPHIFISIHCNSALSSSAAGTEVYYFNEYSKAFAGYASSAISSAMNTNNRGGKFGYYYVTRDPQFPAVLAEIGFLSNRNEYAKLLESSYQISVANGIANSISQAFKYAGAGGANATGTQSTGSTVSIDSSSSQSSSSSESSSEQSTGITLEDLYFEQDYTSVLVGESYNIKAQLEPEDANTTLVWKVTEVDGENVITYTESGNTLKIKAKNSGYVEIMVYCKEDEDIYAVMDVEVLEE